MCPSLTGLEAVPHAATLIWKVTLPGPAERCVKYEQVRVLSPHHNSRKVLARRAACFTEHAWVKSSLLLNSKHFLAAKLTFAVAISISKHQHSHRRADVCPGWTCHEAGVWHTAGTAPESLGAGAAAGAVQQEQWWQEGRGLLVLCWRQWCAGRGKPRSSGWAQSLPVTLVKSFNVSASQISTFSSAASLLRAARL